MRRFTCSAWTGTVTIPAWSHTLGDRYGLTSFTYSWIAPGGEAKRKGHHRPLMLHVEKQVLSRRMMATDFSFGLRNISVRMPPSSSQVIRLGKDIAWHNRCSTRHFRCCPCRRQRTEARREEHTVNRRHGSQPCRHLPGKSQRKHGHFRFQQTRVTHIFCRKPSTCSTVRLAHSKRHQTIQRLPPQWIAITSSGIRSPPSNNRVVRPKR